MLLHNEIFTTKQKADAGDPVALFQMFRLYFEGNLVRKDEELADSYLIRLANLGPLYCSISQGSKFSHGCSAELTGYLLSSYDFIIALIGSRLWHNGYEKDAALWFKKVLDFAENGLPRNWTKEERELVKKDCYAYNYFWGEEGLAGKDYFDEDRYREFKLDWEKPIQPAFLVNGLRRNFKPANN